MKLSKFSSFHIFLGYLIPLLLIHFVPPLCGVIYNDIDFYGSGQNNITINYGDFLNPVKDWIGIYVKKEHHLPLWLSSQGLGIPLIEQTDFNLFNPLEWPNWFFGSRSARQACRGFFTAFYLAFAGLGIFLLCNRVMSLKKSPSFCGGLVYSLAGVPFFYFTYFSAINMVLCLPYIIYFSSSIILRDYKNANFIGLVAVLAIFLVGGQPQFHFCIIFFTIPFLLCLLMIGANVKKLYYLIAAGIVASMIAAPQLIPVIKVQFGDYFSMHNTSVVQPDFFSHFREYINPFKVANFDSAHPARLFRLIYPVFCGTYQLYISYASWPNDVEAFGVTFGTLGAFFLLTGLFAGIIGQKKFPKEASRLIKLVAFFFICILAIVFFHLWPFRFVNVDKYMIVVIAFLGCCLVAVGVDSLFEFSKRKLIVISWLGIVLSILPLILYKALPLKFSFDTSADNFFTTQFSTLLPTIITSIILAVFCTLILLKPAYIRDPKKDFPSFIIILLLGELLLTPQLGLSFEREWFRYLIFLMLCVAAFFNLMKYFKVVHYLLVISLFLYVFCFLILGKNIETHLRPPNLFSLKNVIDKKGLTRFISSTGLQAPRLTEYGIPTFTAYNPVIPSTLQAYFDDFLFISQGQLYKSMIMFTGFTNPENTYNPAPWLSWDNYFSKRKFYNLLGINYLISEKNTYLEQLINKNINFKKISTDDPALDQQIIIYQDLDALPRAYFTNNFEIVPFTSSAWYARQWISTHQDSIAHKFVIETQTNNFDVMYHHDGIQRLAPTLNHTKSNKTVVSATALEEKSGYAKFRVKNSSPGFAVLSEQFHPNWIAIVDGRRGETVRVSSILLGVMVPAGEHQVEFKYMPEDYRRNRKISLFGAISLFLFIGLHYFIRERKYRSYIDKS